MRSTISPSCDLAISHAIMAAKMLPVHPPRRRRAKRPTTLLCAEIIDMLGLAHGAFDAARSTSFTPTPTSKTPFEFIGDLTFQSVHLLKRIGERLGPQLDLHRHRIHAVHGLDDDMVMGRNLLDAGEHVFDLAREDVGSADDEHVVAARADLLHARVRASACAFLGEDAREVVRSVAKHGDGLLIERSEDELAHLSVCNRSPGLRIDDLPKEVIFRNMLLKALGQTLAGDPGPMTSVRP